MARLSESQYNATLGALMRRLPSEAAPPFDFGPYVDEIPASDFAGYECQGDVTYVWEDDSATSQHVLLDSQDENVFMAVILDVRAKVVAGHRLLDLNDVYGLGKA